MSAACTILDPSQTIASLQESLALDGRLIKALQQRMGVQRPTLVQSRVWPLVLQEGRSCLVRAPTGSGKTLAYAIPAVQKILTQPQQQSQSLQALILVPTRELCNQVQMVLRQLSHYCGGSTTSTNSVNNNARLLQSNIQTAILSVGQARGRQQKDEQTRQLAALRDRPNIVVGTPSAVAYAMRQYQQQQDSSAAMMMWKGIHTVVLDEADLLLNLGHEADLRHIVQGLPRLYQGMVVSATLNPAVEGLRGWALLDDPVVIKVEDDTTSSTASPQLKQLYLPIKENDKFLVLYVFLKLGLLQGKGLFFVASTDAGYRLKLFLQLFHIRAAVLNSELPLASRLHIIEQFHLGNMDYLIATDASTGDDREAGDDGDDDDGEEGKDKAHSKSKKKQGDSEYGVSRGVDFHRVSFVVNVDFPPNPTVYRHRIGRTARGGRSGVALSLVSIDPSRIPNTPKRKRSQVAAPPLSDMELLQAVQEDQPRIPVARAAAQTQRVLQAAAAPQLDSDTALDPSSAPVDQAQPILLDFDLQEIEGFRYRVEDISRAVTRKAIKEARTAEIKMEILNSERLQQHFAENPADAKLLQHDRPTAALQAPNHLKHVPKYLLPKGMQVANLNKRRKRKKRKIQDRVSKDPLRSFDADVTLDGLVGGDHEDEEGHDDEQLEMNDERKPTPKNADSLVFTNTQDGTGRSTAGRMAWKERHRKGKFSNKKRKSERRNKDPLGI